MESNINHVVSLLGRVFLISQLDCVTQWNGDKDNEDELSDYNLLDDYISYDESTLSVFKKSLESIFYIYFSMSSKIEIFRTHNSLFICDGLYFNASWDYSQPIKFSWIEEMPFQIKINSNKLAIYDATVDGKNILENYKTGIYTFESKEFNSYSIININKGIYSVIRVKANIRIENQEVLIKGVEIRKRSNEN